MKLVVHEQFMSFQGEGVHIGRAAFFVRLMGCDQRCAFCDAAGTWHDEFMPLNARKLSPREIALEVERTAPDDAFVVITGGEPTLYDLEPLVDELHLAGRHVHLETAGHRPMSPRLHRILDWITLSPKGAGVPPIAANIIAADEFKIIVESNETLERDLALVTPLARKGCSIWLHPEWSQSKNPNVLRLIVETVKSGRANVRAGWQLHKLFNADAFDEGARASVPLGGVAANGSSI